MQALKNALANILEDEQFDIVMGEGVAQEIKDMLFIRFNLDGRPITGRKVGLLDAFHLWCFICDPFSSAWRNHFRIQGAGGLMYHARMMIKHFVPSSEDDYEKTQAALLEEFEVSFLLSVSHLMISL